MVFYASNQTFHTRARAHTHRHAPYKYTYIPSLLSHLLDDASAVLVGHGHIIKVGDEGGAHRWGKNDSKDNAKLHIDRDALN